MAPPGRCGRAGRIVHGADGRHGRRFRRRLHLSPLRRRPPSEHQHDAGPRSNRRIREELGFTPTLLAISLRRVRRAGEAPGEAGYVAAFGQHSGVAHGDEDLYGLPRFAMNEAFGSIDRFRLAASALPLYPRPPASGGDRAGRSRQSADRRLSPQRPRGSAHGFELLCLEPQGRGAASPPRPTRGRGPLERTVPAATRSGQLHHAGGRGPLALVRIAVRDFAVAKFRHQHSASARSGHGRRPRSGSPGRSPGWCGYSQVPARNSGSSSRPDPEPRAMPPGPAPRCGPGGRRDRPDGSSNYAHRRRRTRAGDY